MGDIAVILPKPAFTIYCTHLIGMNTKIAVFQHAEKVSTEHRYMLVGRRVWYSGIYGYTIVFSMRGCP